MNYILSGLPACVLRFPRTLHLLYRIKKLPENNETVAFEIRAEGKTVLLPGSYGLCADETYPKGADLMVFPSAAIPALPDRRRARWPRSVPGGCSSTILTTPSRR